MVTLSKVKGLKIDISITFSIKISIKMIKIGNGMYFSTFLFWHVLKKNLFRSYVGIKASLKSCKNSWTDGYLSHVGTFKCLCARVVIWACADYFCLIDKSKQSSRPWERVVDCFPSLSSEQNCNAIFKCLEKCITRSFKLHYFLVLA